MHRCIYFVNPVCVHTYVEFNILLEPQYLPDPESIRNDRFLVPAADYESEFT